jgi:5-methylcytosine-specific restriction protein B
MRKGQVIFYGPPGTGKTFAAQKLARYLADGADGRYPRDGMVELVQFHPAYAYEDFVQGIRPKTDPATGLLTYERQPGIFLDFCRRAATKRGLCVLIIDEINRANLSQVFGELMYLLEYREQGTALAGGGTLQIPANVRLIGTMNTADRSIALVDHALRRRFAFLPMRPNYELLLRFQAERNVSAESLVQLIRRLNNEIEADYQIGMTYFLRDDLAETLSDIWQTEIEPYLEEYFFDRRDMLALYRWANISQEAQVVVAQ